MPDRRRFSTSSFRHGVWLGRGSAQKRGDHPLCNPNPFGLLDHEIALTLFRQPTWISAFDRDAAALRRDIETLRGLLEAAF